MAYDGYQLAEPVSADSHIFNKKGVMVVGSGNAQLYPYATPNYTSGLTGYAVAGACAASPIIVTGSAQGTIVPVAIAYVGTIGASTTVYNLA